MSDASPHLPRSPRGRGAAANPGNRFERTSIAPLEPDLEHDLTPDDLRADPRTKYIPDHSRTIIARNDSPDIGFDASINPYRGCEHGCAYCYARPTHEYLGYSAGIDFETRILVKHDAPDLLRAKLASPRWQPETLTLSGVTDPYQPAERQLKLTRRCLEVLADFRNPVAIVTKNALVTRDIDLLGELAEHRAARVFISLTTLDADLARKLEPRTSTPRARLDAIAKLTAAGIPTGVMTAPLIPGLNDHELPSLLTAAAQAGASRAGYVLLRLPHGVKELFVDWLDRHAPGHRDKVLNRLREMRGGKLYDARFGARGRGEGIWADQLAALFDLARRRAGLDRPVPELSTTAFRRPPPRTGQLELF